MSFSAESRHDAVSLDSNKNGRPRDAHELGRRNPAHPEGFKSHQRIDSCQIGPKPVGLGREPRFASEQGRPARVLTRKLVWSGHGDAYESRSEIPSLRGDRMGSKPTGPVRRTTRQGCEGATRFAMDSKCKPCD